MNPNKPLDVEAWLQALGAPSADRDYLPGHERVLALLVAAKDAGLVPAHQPRFRVRVAGTNGKGSTAHFLAAGLQVSGLKVGLYTSPHMVSFHERIQVQGIPVADHALQQMMQRLMPFALEIGASYFETATVLALAYFAQQQVEVEILEAGVGAKLDATTAMLADVGVLTPVGLDHQAWLGDTLDAIAEEKAHVFDGCTIKVAAPQLAEVRQVLDSMIPSITYAQPWQQPLVMCGAHQRINAGVAWQALKAIDAQLYPLDLSACAQAIAQTQVMGRMQHVQALGHDFWLDAAHNEHAIRALLPTLEAMPRFDVLFLCSREDRDLRACVPLLQPFAHRMVVMTGAQPYPYPSVQAALTAETQSMTSGRFLLLGSFMTLGETVRWLQDRQRAQ